MSYLEIYAADILDLSMNNTFHRTADSLASIGQRCVGNGLSVPESRAGSGFEWNFYPNPAADELHISLTTTAVEPVEIEIRNMAGQLLKMVSLPAGSARNVTLNVADCPPGLWLLALKKGGLTYGQRRLLIIR